MHDARASSTLSKTTSAELSLSAAIGPRLSLDLYDVAGPYVQLEAGLTATNGSDATTVLGFTRLSGGIHMDLGPTLSYNADFGDILDAQTTLATWPRILPPSPSPRVVATAPGSNLTGGTFATGDHFDDLCQVAWPTAPTRGTNGIDMTMTCQHVSQSSYFFVEVSYDDPNLDVTPSTGFMRIQGTVVGSARSDYGYTVLGVHADRITK